MRRSQKQCVPDTLAGAPGTSPAGEGADRPTPHPDKIATAPKHSSARGCVFVWRDGMLSTDLRGASLTVLQLALLTRGPQPAA